ncbi:MAG TPA: general secretion pathway protein GspB [Steroidobacteraceae bacterium]|nr:general secretion pathway protein GspB [Steroidobacteraceae bacterium]
MSFILDALKKSESERQRQNGPALFEVKVAPPRSRFAMWAIALGTLLAVNGVVVGWMLVRGPTRRAVAEPSAQQSLEPTPAPAPASRPRSALAEVIEPASAPPSVQPAAPPPSQSVVPPPQAALATQDAASSVATPTADAADFAPAVEPSRAQQPPDGGVVRETASGLPTYQDAAAVPGANIPPLQLDLHAYSAQPGQSFVDLNSKILHEGDALADGVRVERITADGVILSYHGTQFVLYAQRR